MKNLDYYMALKYRLEVEEIPDELGGGISLSIPLLGRESVVADGETYDEAKNNLETVKSEYFEYCISQNIEIPEPDIEQETYSGKFLVRVPKELHRTIAKKAKENGSSLNQYITYLIQEGLSTEKTKVFLELSKWVASVRRNEQVIASVIEPQEWKQAENFYVNDMVGTWQLSPTGIAWGIHKDSDTYVNLFKQESKNIKIRS
jgi:antitoxin HicB